MSLTEKLWNGEPVFLRAFGLLGYKALVMIMLDELNELRAKQSMPARTLAQFLTALDAKMAERADDVKGK